MSKKLWGFIWKRLLIFIVTLGLALVGAQLDQIADVVVTFASSVIIFVIAFDLFSFLFFYEKYIERKEITSHSEDIDHELFYWAGRFDLSDNLINDLFSKNSPEKSMSNLNTLKTKINKACADDKNTLYLLRNYIELKNRDNISKNTRSILITAIVGVIVTTISQLNTEHSILIFIHNLISKSEETLTVSAIATYITYCTYGLIALMGFLFLRQIITKSKNRIRLLAMVVDSCIYDFEKNDKTEKK